ncbi:MAG: hypothetical protein EBU90_03980 [Proteobacteria bacterium]|nr:hypothetical protein [Pseudomonadota bacterium]NBP14229.1 hypothetical protein [bacterium]
MFILRLIFLCAILGSSCFAGTIDPNNPDSEYIKFGEKHQCVIPISGIDKSSNRQYHASCVVIKPKVIVTAAHILTETVEETAFILFNNEKIKIIAYVYPKDFHLDKHAEKDIAVALLEKDVIIDFYPELYDNDDEIGKICSISGHGITGNYFEGAVRYDGKKRAGSNIVDEISNELLVCSVRGTPKTRLEFLIANGDSGGGLFIDKKLAGINSCVMAEDKKADSNFADWSGHTRVSLHKKWIDEISEKFSTLPEKKE